jgi:hypothetical protein
MRRQLSEKHEVTSAVQQLLHEAAAIQQNGPQVFKTEKDGKEWVVLPSVFAPMIFALGDGTILFLVPNLPFSQF